MLKRMGGFVIKSITKITLITLVMLLMVIGVVGCAKVAETPQPAVAAWSLKLTGVSTEIITQEEFEKGADPSCHGAECNIKVKEGVAYVYSGIPLWVLCGRVDDEVEHGEGAFNDELASKGYNITVIGVDGYSITLSSETIARNNGIILANEVDGQSLSQKEAPLKLVGIELKSQQMVRNVVEIRLNLSE